MTNIAPAILERAQVEVLPRQPTRIEAAYLEGQPWGQAFLREMDLVIAANEFESICQGFVLYDAVLEQRVAAFCRPLDPTVEERFLGVISLEQLGDEPAWMTLKRALASLAEQPRGHWAVYEQAGRFDSYMSNGVGGTDTASGEKFLSATPAAPNLSFDETFPHVYGYEVYKRRSRIRDEIITASAAAANVQPGRVFKDVRLSGATWSNVTFVGVMPNYFVGRTNAYKVRATRRGVRAHEFVLEPKAFFSIAKLQPVMPAAYVDDGNRARLQTVGERRGAAAQSLWDRLLSTDTSEASRAEALAVFDRLATARFGPYASRASFRSEGDQMSRPAYETDGTDRPARSHTFIVRFRPGSDVITSASIERTSS
ncbi:hypothetical protein [Sphingosinicella sp. BN140058]|uniref:hypothetical protein n=1 Tax=Sphingosinicella sp. BN140058 TaxID=1892855 RepID=UPI0010127814|nr:hypothetical protein [Sphingosinicella sp. BN140058]QAY80325.1 hypothetical protein ETR14_27160 [Sphingosinicella sp. BN140058]